VLIPTFRKVINKLFTCRPHLISGSTTRKWYNSTMNKNSQYTISSIKAVSIPILKKYNVIRAGIFGSYAKYSSSPKSDIDFLVEVPRGTGLFKFASLKIALEEALDREVDLVSYNSIKPQIKAEILSSEQKIL